MTPMMQQYFSIKEKYQDAILFYRMGDFYEMFYGDADTASRILDITLTSRNKNNDTPVPMCGVPVKAADNYIGRLIKSGRKVAVCEQVEDPSQAKGIVKRDVVRVITPGMIVDNALLDEKKNNYILSMSGNREPFGISFLDISTGTFKLAESDSIEKIKEEIFRIVPSEMLVPESYRLMDAASPILNGLKETHFSFLDDNRFDPKTGKELLVEQFETRSLEGFGCENKGAGIAAAGALLSYVRETQKQKTGHIRSIEPYSLDSYLHIDDMSSKNLELLANLQTGARRGTLIDIIDKTITAMGGRLLKQWLGYPLIDPDAITNRLEAVRQAKEHAGIRQTVREHFKSVYDMERLVGKITMGRCNARELIALKHTLNTLPLIFSEISGFDSGLFTLDVSSDPDMFNRLYGLGELIEKAVREDAPMTINEGGMIKKGYDESLDELMKISSDAKGWLARLEVEEKQKTGINSLKVKYNKVFGYYIEVPKTHMDAIPPHYVRKQTLVNAERYITDELKQFETKVLGAQDRMAEIELNIFNDIRSKVEENSRYILRVARFIAELDCIMGFAEAAEQNDYTMPEMNRDGLIHIKEGRHPVVEKMITGERYVPNTIKLDNTDLQVLIITGPNMAGKSTVLRQAALITILAHMGSFVPAAHATISLTDKIFTRVGALDNLSSGQSTFMVEMEETARIMNNATSESLVILDEIGRGTSTYDGMSIAWAVAEYLHDLGGTGVKTLFATHYHELIDLADQRGRVKNFNIAVKEWNEKIIFLRKLEEGGTARSYGIQVARLAGMPETIIARAKHVLKEIEKKEGGSGGRVVAGGPEKEKGLVQLDLFRTPEQIVVEKLRKMNISTMTPLDAINCLSELKEKVTEE